jgi:hypothetical protein
MDSVKVRVRILSYVSYVYKPWRRQYPGGMQPGDPLDANGTLIPTGKGGLSVHLGSLSATNAVAPSRETMKPWKMLHLKRRIFVCVSRTRLRASINAN